VLKKEDLILPGPFETYPGIVALISQNWGAGFTITKVSNRLYRPYLPVLILYIVTDAFAA
jgi:hypothetical protein